MSDHRLPEDIRQWPIDPFALLGVNQSSDRREVRRAYAQLIRVYKPEHSPEQFRRIRDAYEFVEQRLAWMEAVSTPETVETPDEKDLPAADAGNSKAREEKPAGDVAAPVPSAPGDGEPARQDGDTGDLAETYTRLAGLARQGRAAEEMFARLFWMLRVAPEVDPGRDPRDWLAAGMKQCGLRGRLPELYRWELLEDPQEAFSTRCEEVIHCSGHSGLLAEVVIARWAAAAKLHKWEIIVQDLPGLRDRTQDESPIWGRLLLAAIDFLVWAEQGKYRQTLTACREEIEKVAEHFLPMAGELDQRDNLLELVEACDRLKFLANLPLEWRKSLRSLLADSWNQPFEHCRHRLIDVSAPLVQNPVVGLSWLDRLEASCGPALHRFGTLIVALANECGVGREVPPPEVLRDRLIEFLIAVTKKYPDRWLRWMQAANQRDRSGRVELLIFCLQESVTMRHMCDLLASGVRQDLAQFLGPASSAPLHIVCLAYLAFWA